MRLLLWLGLFLFVVLAIRKKVNGSRKPGESSPLNATSHSTEQEVVKTENMVCCDHCQLHFPVSDAIYKNDKIYCCIDHSEQK